MFCAVEGPPLILRLYGRGFILGRSSSEYRRLLNEHFNDAEPLGARQMVRIDVELVKTSRGYGVPFHEYVGERPTADKWAEAKGVQGIEDYWKEQNRKSMDGFETRVDIGEPVLNPEVGSKYR